MVYGTQYVSIHYSCEHYAYMYIGIHMRKILHLDLWNGFVGLYVRDVVVMLERANMSLASEHRPAWICLPPLPPPFCNTSMGSSRYHLSLELGRCLGTRF